MFNKGKGCWVKPFSFTEDQHNTIIECFGGALRRKTKRSEKADEFISGLEPIIEFWISLEDEPKSDNSEIEDRLSRIAKQCEKLMQAVSEVDKKMSCALGVELSFYNHKNQIPLSEYDTENAINSLMVVSQNLAQRYSQRSTSKASEKELTLLMAYCYWRVFGKFPGSSEESNFSQVVQVVSGFLDVTIGHSIIKEATKEIKGGKTPAFFSFN